MSLPHSHLSSTEVVMHYYLPPLDGARPYKNINDRTDHNYIRDSKTVLIEDIRGKEHLFTLDTAGFQYYVRPAKHKAFTTEEEIHKEYYPESIELIKELTGSNKVYLFDHTIRRHIPGLFEESPQKRQPVANVHVDQTSTSAMARVHRHLPESEREELLQRRFQILNLWRPICHVAYDWPLGFIDSRTIDPKRDLMAMTLKFPGGPGETYGVKYHPDHKWVYQRGMQPEEVVLFKCFDSLDDGSVCKFNGHSGFSDPNTPEGSPFRESIELRALVFY